MSSPKKTADGVGWQAASAPISRGEDGAIKAQLDKAIRERDEQRYLLRLYVTGVTTASGQAIERVRAVCEEHLHGRYELQVIDIHQLPALAKDEQIVATPTLIKVLPAPLRRYIGNLANVEKVLFGLDLRARSC
ncbi:MAG TPA: circadian clock KaiB family protein [Anaeromyxobacteraceae bacterium]|nr:circadian clock KaiB family protein [Anaeromyxobacteraceae bacterium]